MFYFQFSWQIKYQNCFKNKARKTSDSVIFLTRFRSTMHVHVAYVNKMCCAFLRFIVDQHLGKTKDALDNIYMTCVCDCYLISYSILVEIKQIAKHWHVSGPSSSTSSLWGSVYGRPSPNLFFRVSGQIVHRSPRTQTVRYTNTDSQLYTRYINRDVYTSTVPDNQLKIHI